MRVRPALPRKPSELDRGFTAMIGYFNVYIIKVMLSRYCVLLSSLAKYAVS